MNPRPRILRSATRTAAARACVPALALLLAGCGGNRDAGGPGGGEAPLHAGTYRAEIEAGAKPARRVTLTLDPDRTASMSTEFPAGGAPVREEGTWREASDGRVTVLLDGGTAPNVVTFRHDGDSLIAVSFYADLYGSDGPRLRRER